MISARHSLSLLAFISFGLAAPLGSVLIDPSDALANGQDAQKLNALFATLNEDVLCTDGAIACIGPKLAQCASGTWFSTECSDGTQCFAVPLVNSRGSSVACTTEEDALSRIQATGAEGGITGNGSSEGNSTSPDSEPSNISATDNDSVDSGSPQETVVESSVVADGTITQVSSPPTSTSIANSDPDNTEEDEADCPADDESAASTPLESTVAASVDEPELTATTTNDAEEPTGTPVEDTSAASGSAEELSDGSSDSAPLYRRQDAIGDIQSTVILLSSDAATVTDSISVNDPAATGLTDFEIDVTATTTEGVATGAVVEETVTVTTTITAVALVGTQTIASELPPDSATDVIEGAPLLTAVPTETAATGTASDAAPAGLPTDSIAASPVLESENPAIPTESPVLSEPLQTPTPAESSPGVSLSDPLVADTALPSVSSAEANEIPTTTPAPEPEAVAAESPSESSLLESSDIAFLITATI